MPNQKVPQLPILTAVTGSDLFYVVDVSDTTDDPTGSSKQITRDNVLTNVNQIDFNLTAVTTHSEGRVSWNDSIKSLEIDTENPDVQLKVGHEMVIRVNNQTGGVLTKGRAVYINGEQGNRPTVTYGTYTGDSTSAAIVGLIADDISNNQNGYVIVAGLLEGINTSSYVSGTPLYLFTGGTLTSTKPQAPNHDVRIAKVVVQDATIGSLYVSVQNGYELDEIHDVRITSVSENDVLVRSTYNGSPVWVNTKTMSGLTYVGATTISGTSISATTITADTVNTYIPTFSSQEIFRGVTFSNNSTTVTTSAGITMSSTASNLAISVSSTDFSTKQIRLRYYSTTVTGGRYTGTRGSALLWYIHGGFRYVCDFRISDTSFASDCQQFYGMAGVTADLGYGGVSLTQVSTLTNLIGVGNDGSDTNLQIIHNDASGAATKIDLGVGFPANRTVGAASSTMYSVTLYNPPTSSNVKYMVVNNETGAVAMGEITTNLPLTTQGLNFFASRAMGGGGGVTGSGQFELSKLGVYSLL